MIEAALSIDVWTYAAFFAATGVLLITPGPNMMFCIACGLTGGPRAGIAAGAGASAGMLVHAVLVAAGVASLIAASETAFDALRIVGALYLLYLAWTSWRAGDDLEERLGRRRVSRAFGRGLVTNLMNPKVILFMVALLPQFADPAVGPIWKQIMVFGVLQAVLTLIFDATYGGLAGVVAEKLRRVSRLMNRISAVVFGGLAARLLVE